MIFSHLTGFLRKHGRIPKGALDRTSNTNLRERNMHIRGRLPRKDDFLVLTLDPNKFTEKKQRRLYIGNLGSFVPYVTLRHHLDPVKAPRLFYDQAARSAVRHLQSPCPPDTKAFLYFFTSPEQRRIAGELRLRVASSDDSTSFESGFDLLKLNGRPWSLPLFFVSKCYIPLYEKLREDRLVRDDLASVLSTFSKKFSNRQSQVLYTLNDTFIADFGKDMQTLHVITEKGMELLLLTKLFKENRQMRLNIQPYTGRALVRFERSTFADHEGTRTVVLRFIKIITPVKCTIPIYDGFIAPPQEGKLHRRTFRSFHQRVWSVNIDIKKSYSGLRLLWDT